MRAVFLSCIYLYTRVCLSVCSACMGAHFFPSLCCIYPRVREGGRFALVVALNSVIARARAQTYHIREAVGNFILWRRYGRGLFREFFILTRYIHVICTLFSNLVLLRGASEPFSSVLFFFMGSWRLEV